MKKICVLVLLVMLGLPGAAQAYFFEVTSFSYDFAADPGNVYPDTFGDQVDFVANNMGVDTGLSGTVTTSFILHSDYGMGIGTAVEATLTDISNYTGYTPAETPYSLTSTFTLYEPVGENLVSVLSDTFSVNDSAPSAQEMNSSLEYYDDLILITGMQYTLEFTFDVDAAAFTSANREISIDINQEESPKTPIPGAVWLLGTGLVGLAGLRRKLG